MLNLNKISARRETQNDHKIMPNVRTTSENESSEDGSSSLEPQPSTPPVDKMGSEKEVHHQHKVPSDHRYSSFADAVTKGHSAGAASVTAYQNRDGAGIDHATKSSNETMASDPHETQLPPRAPQRCEETTQPLSSGKTSQMSFTFDTDSRANTPSGIMKEMSLKEKEVQVSKNAQYTESNINIGGEGAVASQETASKQSPTISSETTDKTAAKTTTTTTTTTDQAGTFGVGAMLSQYNSQHPHQQQQTSGPEHITTYYSMASQCSLPIHTPTAVAPDNERMRKLSKEFLRSPEHTFERLSFILGRGRLVMVRDMSGFVQTAAP